MPSQLHRLYLLTYLLTHSMVQVIWNADCHTTRQKIASYGTQRLVESASDCIGYMAFGMKGGCIRWTGKDTKESDRGLL